MKAWMSAVIALLFCGAFTVSGATRIDDPVVFVRDVLQHFIDAQSRKQTYKPPEDIYTAELSKLFRDDKKRSHGEVGCLEFVFWVNGQDWTISKLDVSAGEPSNQSRKMVIAKFDNLGTQQEIHFAFRKVAGRWLLDDVKSLKEPGWTLSKILSCAP